LLISSSSPTQKLGAAENRMLQTQHLMLLMMGACTRNMSN